MSAYDSFRQNAGAAGMAGRIGTVFLNGYGATPERGGSASYEIAASVSRFFSALSDAIVDWNDAV